MPLGPALARMESSAPVGRLVQHANHGYVEMVPLPAVAPLGVDVDVRAAGVGDQHEVGEPTPGGAMRRFSARRTLGNASILSSLAAMPGGRRLLWRTEEEAGGPFGWHFE